jgi:hypothetical protein
LHLFRDFGARPSSTPGSSLPSRPPVLASSAPRVPARWLRRWSGACAVKRRLFLYRSAADPAATRSGRCARLRRTPLAPRRAPRQGRRAPLSFPPARWRRNERVRTLRALARCALPAPHTMSSSASYRNSPSDAGAPPRLVIALPRRAYSVCVNAVSKPEFVTGSAPAGPPHECRNAGCAADGPRASAPGSAAAGARSRCAWPRTPALAGPRLGHADVAELCGPHRRPAAKAAVDGGPLPRMHPDTASVMPYTSSALPLSSVQANVAEFSRRTLAPDEARASRGSGLSSSRRSVCRGKR